MVIPGIIDLHSDVLEKELEPRPNTLFPTDMVLFELDKKLTACGITTMYHSISYAEGEIGIRSNKMADTIVEAINRLSPRLRVRTKVHARYEVTDEEAIPSIERLIGEGKIHLLSFMDHSPGQGQFRDDEAFKEYFGAVYQKSEADVDGIIKRKMSEKRFAKQRLDYLVRICRSHGIKMASHDDDTPEKVQWVQEKGIHISEFPVTMDAVRAANEHRLHVCLGAPNALRGRSQGGNLSARNAIALGLGHILCSDYAPMTLLHAAFKLADLGLLPLHEAINMISRNPAKALGIDRETGSLEEGKNADLIIAEESNGHCHVLKTFVAGQEVFSTCLK